MTLKQGLKESFELMLFKLCESYETLYITLFQMLETFYLSSFHWVFLEKIFRFQLLQNVTLNVGIMRLIGQKWVKIGRHISFASMPDLSLSKKESKIKNIQRK